MSQQVLNLGTVDNDGTGTTLKAGGDMINDNFAELYGIWIAVPGTYASATTFTYTGGSDKTAKLDLWSLFTCTDSAGTTRRVGYVKSSVNSSGTVTVTVVSSSDLAANDKDFKIAYTQKITNYLHLVSIPGECIADASFSQGTWKLNMKYDWYLLSVNFAVRVAAAGAGASLTVNIYKDATALFSTAPDLTTNLELNEQRPTTNSGSAGEDISLRIPASAGATNKAADFQAELFITPQSIWTAF